MLAMLYFLRCLGRADAAWDRSRSQTAQQPIVYAIHEAHALRGRYCQRKSVMIVRLFAYPLMHSLAL